MEKSSQQSLEERFKHALRLSRISCWESDSSFETWHYTSPNTEDLFGVPASQLLGKHSIYLSFIHPDDYAQVLQVYQSVADFKKKYEVVYRFQRPDGQVIILHEYGEPIIDKDGVLLGFQGISQNITQLRDAQAEARLNLDRLNYAEEMASITHWEADAAFENQTYVSDNTEHMYETSNADMLGDFSKFTDRLHPDDKKNTCLLYESIRKEPRFYELEYRFILTGGRIIDIRETGKPIRNDDGAIIGFRGTTQNISDFKMATLELEKSNAYAAAIVDTAQDGIITIDGKGIVETINSAAERMFGYAADEIIGNNIKMLMPPHDAGRHDNYLSSYLITGEAKIIGIGREVIGKRKNGREFPMNLSISEMKFGNKRSFAGIIRDSTERNNRELQLNEALRRAEDANRAKTEFLASMSHELRTPLNAVIGFSSAIIDELFGPIGNAKYLEYTSDINASGTHLLALINEVLDVSAIEAGKLELSEEIVDLGLATEAAMRLIRERAKAAKIELSNTIETDFPQLLADPRRIQQVLLNLLSNAVKFTPRGGRVDVSAGLEGDGGITLRISDTGIGMDARGIAKAMTKFGQVDSGLNRKHEGTGLGLPLTERLIELHGGTLEITSEIGKGTVVLARFPASRVCDQ